MDNTALIYRYELKKLLQKKLFWSALLISMVCIVFSVVFPLLGSYVVNGAVISSNYEQHVIDQGYHKVLSGRVIDRDLLEETMEAYSHVPRNVSPYSVTEEYQTYARPYSEIFRIIWQWMGMNTASAMEWQPDEQSLYATWEQRIQNAHRNSYLSEGEMAYWQDQVDSLPLPIQYQYHDGYAIMLELFLTVGVMMLLYIAIVIAGIFPDEHSRRTDQLILCTIHGRTAVYRAKLAAGITAGLGGAILMILSALVPTLLIYGIEGFNAPVRLFLSNYAMPLTLGQTCLIAYGVLLVTAVLMSVLVMFLSELLGSSLAALAITTGMILAGSFIMIPMEYRILSQLWDSLPTTYLAIWNVFDCRLIPLMGQYFPSYRVVPMVYLLIALLLAIMGQRTYRRYQVTGR